MKQSLIKLFRRRWFAVLLCVVGVVASTLLNTRVGLGRQCAELQERFYAVGGEQQSIGSQLQNLCNATTGLTAIAGHYSLDSAAANTANEYMKLALKYSPEEAGFLHADYVDLLDAADELIGRLEQAQLSKRDAENLELYSAAIDQARSSIEASDYNEYVRDFLRANDRFPTGGLAAFAGVRMPELFQ